MIYSRFGIRLHLMKEADLEMVRQWRNDPEVVRNYEFREYITPEMQQEWFRKVNNLNNLYMIIEYKGNRIGVINMKNIDWENHTGEGGIFIPDTNWQRTAVSAILSYMATELQYKFFNWWLGYASVMKDNKPGQAFVKNLGYTLCPGQEEKENQLYVCTKETFEKNSARMRKAFEVLADTNDPSLFIIERLEFEDELVLKWEQHFLSFMTPVRTETKEDGRYHYFS